MNFKKFLIAASPALLLASCASDEPVVNPGGGNEGSGNPVYAKIRVQVPGAVRSTTEDNGYPNSSSGFEVGQSYENNIESVNLVLAVKDANGKFKVVAQGKDFTSESVVPNPDASKTNEYTILFKDETLKQFAEQTVYIFAYCNYTGNGYSTTAFDENTDLESMTTTINNVNTNGDVAGAQGIWESSRFLMVNAPNTSIPSKELPSENDLLNKYNTPEKALNLGVVDVARVASRFDFKVSSSAGNPDNTYAINDANDANVKLADIELVSMAPYNIAKEFYTLPRVSADGTSSSWTLCGNEVSNNYVVSPFFVEKAAGTFDGTHFFSPLNRADFTYETYDYVNINDWADNAKDDDDANWEGIQGYKIWRYVTENTIPGIDNQKAGISTGIVFKGRIINATGLMGEAINAGKNVYGYKGTWYGGIANLRRVVANLDENAQMRKDFLKVFPANYLTYKMEPESEGSTTLVRKYEVEDAALVDCAPEANNSIFKVLRPENGEYYVYYVYRNRHNDNGNPAVMGIMEFATVRNNVYKLAVNTISDFGHTADPKDDDKPDDPDDPDEDPKTYFKVSCRVLPWVVRVNNIDF